MCFACGSFSGHNFLRAAGAAAAASDGNVVSDYTALLSGSSWNGPHSEQTQKRPVFITYSFPTQRPAHAAADIEAAAPTWRPLSASEQREARKALKAWSDVSGIVFLEAKEDHGDILFSWIDFGKLDLSDAGAFAFYPESSAASGSGEAQDFSARSGDIYLNSEIRYDAFSGTYRKAVLLHEIGHAIGLKHPFEAGGPGDKILEASVDNGRRTVMSYTDLDWAIKLGPFDIQAARALYGMPQQDGGNVASWSWNAQKEVLTLIGRSRADSIRGTGVTDVIKGAAGADELFGLGGRDALHGGKGNDTLSGGDGRDCFVFDTRPHAKKNVDTILAFDTAGDRIQLENKIFAKLGNPGKLKAKAFWTGAEAHDASDRILYDTGTGAISYDPDGTGRRPPVKFAQLDDAALVLKASHFFVI